MMISYGDALEADVAILGNATAVTLSGPKATSFRTTASGAIGTPIRGSGSADVGA